MSKKFTASQSALIIEKNIIDAGITITPLIELGLKGGNIFVTKEPSFINRYFSVRKINFLFVDGDLYAKCARCIQKYIALRDTHAFVFINSNEKTEPENLNKSSRLNFISKPVKEYSLKKLVSVALDQNFLDYWTEDYAGIA